MHIDGLARKLEGCANAKLVELHITSVDLAGLRPRAWAVVVDMDWEYARDMI